MESTSINVKSLFSENVKALDTYIMFRIQQDVILLTETLTAKKRPPINLSMGAPVQNPPDIMLKKLTEILYEPKISTYSIPKGEPYFLEAVAKRMKNRFNVTVDPKTEVTSLIGSKEGLANLFRAFLTPSQDPNKKEIILTPDPGYASYNDAIKVAGGIPFPVPLTPENDYKPSPVIIEKLLKEKGYSMDRVKMFIVSYPSNPLGSMADLDYYKQVIDFGKRHNILICSDAAYADLYFSKEVPPSILEVEGAKEIAIEMHTLSKPYAVTGWRVGFAVGNSDAVGVLAKIKSTVDTGICKIFQKVCAFALTSPECDRYIEEANKVYKGNLDLMVKGFKELGWPIDESKVPQATFYLWLPIPKRYKNAETFATDILNKSGIVVVPGTAFGNNGEGYFRLSLVDSRDKLQEVLDRMHKDGFTYS